MLADRELVALLYRADWTRLCLSGEVSGAGRPGPANVTGGGEWRLGTEVPFPPAAPGTKAHWPHLTRLLLAPGKRYREESGDGQSARGCDGERIWEWLPGAAPEGVGLIGGPEPPFPVLLCPSWLLAGYDLEVRGRVKVCGRDGIRVMATPRRSTHDTDMMCSPFSPPSLPVVQSAHADAVVDSALGILLRCERGIRDGAPELTEFRSLTVDPALDPGQFTAPAGSAIGEGYGSFFGHLFGGAGWEAAKTAAGLAAGGLGAAVRYSPFGPFGPLRRARPPQPEDGGAEADIPQDEPVPGDIVDGPPVSDEVLHLLYRGGAGVPWFTATLHQWCDPIALLATVPPSARKAGFGGVGFLIDTLGAAAREAGEQPPTDHLVSSVRIGGWDRYRIDRTYRTPRRERHRGRDNECVTVASDGQQRWRVYSDRVTTGPSAPPPAELTDLADGSWLLRCRLSGGSAMMAGDRRAYRISVAGSWSASPLMLSSFPAVAVLDAESGRLLRLTCYGAGRPLTRYELRDVAPGRTSDFGYEPPAGLPVAEEPSGEGGSPPPVNPLVWAVKAAADAVKQRAGDKVATARARIDSLLGTRPPRR